MFGLCRYKNALGKPGKGIHSFRIANIAVADGLLTSLSERTFRIICDNVEEIITVNEDEIIRAMRLIWERMKIIIEPSSAVPLAVVLKNSRKFKSSRIAIILSGGNVDLGNLPWK